MDEISPKDLLIVTDLDGTLLDHHDYSPAPVLPLLRQLATLNIPVIANTSKTRSEWLAMNEALHASSSAFVVENGSAIYLPASSGDFDCTVLGQRRERILEVLQSYRKHYKFEGFADWSTDQVIEHTGLPPDDAKRAQDRGFSEPLLWLDSDSSRKAFCKAIADDGFKTFEGGRFLHVLGITDKGKPLELLRKHYNARCVIALGDSPNDVTMLQQADIGIVITSPTRELPLTFESDNRLLRSTQYGPDGWAEMIAPLLEELRVL